MPDDTELQSICNIIQKEYSACDDLEISDALLKLKVPAAGCIHPDISSIRDSHQPRLRLVAPISTVLFVRKSQVQNSPGQGNTLPMESNIPKGQNWTDFPAPGTIALVQQPEGETNVALLGDIMVTRLKTRGVLGAVVDGRIRDVESCAARCDDGNFQLWSRGFSAVSPTLEVLPWAVNVPLLFGEFSVNPGDILCADEGDRAVVAVPRNLLHPMLEILPILKQASNNVMQEVQNGLSLPDAVKRHPKFYSNYS